MIYYLNKKRNNTEKTKETLTYEVDTAKIINLLTYTSSIKPDKNIKNTKANIVKEAIKVTLESFKEAYKNLIITEVELLNLKTATDDLENKNNFVNDLRLTISEYDLSQKIQ